MNELRPVIISRKQRKPKKRKKTLDYSVHSRRKSVCEIPPECGILEASFEEGMERNHLGNFDQDRGQLSEATEGLHGCKRRTF